MTTAHGLLRCLTRSQTSWTGIRKTGHLEATGGNWILFFPKIKANSPYGGGESCCPEKFKGDTVVLISGARLLTLFYEQ